MGREWEVWGGYRELQALINCSHTSLWTTGQRTDVHVLLKSHYDECVCVSSTTIVSVFLDLQRDQNIKGSAALRKRDCTSNYVFVEIIGYS